jgi:FkbM family methyltransferase
MEDLWTRLQQLKKPIVLYGMGNGADKILSALEKYGITVSDFFASDGYVRGHSFHGKRVLSFSEVCEKYSDFVILLSFGSNRPEVLSRFYALDSQYEVYAPDVPVAGETLFTQSFYEKHLKEFTQVRNLLADELSVSVFDRVIQYRLTGSIRPLKEDFTGPEDVWKEVLHPSCYRTVVDLGAYTGDSIRQLFQFAQDVNWVEAVEPDEKSFKKLSAFARECNGKVRAIHAAAWNRDEEALFSSEGNRNSSLFGSKGKEIVPTLSVDRLLSGRSCDFLKMDVEGAEWEALQGSVDTLKKYCPDLAVSVYHRSEDLYRLPLLVHDLCPTSRLYLRRPEYIPAWDLCLYAVKP